MRVSSVHLFTSPFRDKRATTMNQRVVQAFPYIFSARKHHKQQDKSGEPVQKEEGNKTMSTSRLSKNACCHVFFSGFLIRPSARSKGSRMQVEWVAFCPCFCRHYHSCVRNVLSGRGVFFDLHHQLSPRRRPCRSPFAGASMCAWLLC